MDWILSFLSQAFALFKPVTDFAKESPGAGIVVAAGIAYVSVLLRTTPGKLWAFSVARMTTTIEFDNSPHTGSKEAFENFNTWFQEKRVKWSSRKARIFFHWITHPRDPNMMVRQPTISPYESRHLIFWERRPCFVTVRREGDGKMIASDTPFAASITRLGRDMGSLMRLIESFNVTDPPTYPYRRALISGGWDSRGLIRPRPIETVATNDNLVNKIIALIEDFETKEEWYLKRGIPYKLCICLHGPPGTGKNSIVRAVASHLRRGLDCVNVADVSDSGLATRLQDNHNRGLLLFDDFDCKQFNARFMESTNASAPSDAPVVAQDSSKESFKESFSMTLAGFLSILDGENTPHGRIFFLNTNHFDKLDPAITRPGRINHVFHVGLLEHGAIVNYLRYQFDLKDVSDFGVFEFAPVSGARLEQVYKENWQSLPDIIELLEKVQ